jgi:uncharacterized membrane protein YeaQ/YmgE (transglycosylase-associated protein family)
MNDIGALIIGFLIGILANLVTGGHGFRACLVTAGLGTVGAMIATRLGHFIGWYRPGETAGFIGAAVGAVIILAIHHALTGSRHGRLR